MTYNPDIHHRRSIRLKGYDYSSGGAYFVTICAHGRECLFGQVVNNEMQVNDAGEMLENVWFELPGRFPNVVLDTFVVMPNHFHGIVLIVGAPLAAPFFESPGVAAPFFESQYGNEGTTKRGAASSATLGEIMRAFKSISAVKVNRLLGRQGRPLWQRNYYERIIRNDEELYSVREYIMCNPAKWAEDEENPVR